MARQRPPLDEKLRTEQVAELCKLFGESLAASREWRAFEGPTAYFYGRVVGVVKSTALSELAGNAAFLDYVYAALATWMGSLGPRVVPFEKFCAIVPRFTAAAAQFADTSILDVHDEGHAREIATTLAPLFDTPGLMTSSAPSIVPASKLLHFLVPDLIPPIDRKYSLKFFFGRREPPRGYPVSDVFRVVFTASVAIAQQVETIGSISSLPTLTESPFCDAATIPWRSRRPGHSGHQAHSMPSIVGSGRGHGANGPFDVPIVQSPLDDVLASGKVVAGSQTVLADAAFVVAVRKGAPKADVTSADGLRRTLLGARAITFPPPGATLAGDRVVESFKKLGIAAEMEPKVTRVQGVSLEELVTRGDVDVAVTFGSEIHDPGIEVLGVLPAPLIAPIPHVAFLSSQTKVPDAARALLNFLSSPAAAGVYAELRMRPGSGAGAQQTNVPAIPFDPSDPLRLPDGMYLGEVAGVAVNSKGNIFVYARTASAAAIRGMRNAQLFEFDRNGKFIREIGHNLYSMAQAHAVRFDRQDNIWLVDNGSHTVVKLTPEGRPLIVLGRRPESVEAYDPPNPPTPVPPAQPGMFNRPTDVAFDSAGNVYVSDGYRNSRVAKFDRDGHIVKSWGERGTKPGQFNLVHGIAIDNKDNVYVSDRSNARIQVFNAEGEFLREIPRPLPLSRTPPPIPGFGMNDRGEYNSLFPLALCINPGPNQFLYAIEAIPGYIYKMTLDGKLLGTIGTAGKKIGQFAWVHAIACPSENELYVGELLNWRVQKLILRPDRATTSSR